MEWPARDGRADTRLYRDESGAHMWIDGAGCFDIDPRKPSIAVPKLDERRLVEGLSSGVTEAHVVAWREVNTLGVPTMLCFMEQGFLPLHAASVDVEGSAILLGAPGTFGKTTLSGAFHSAGHRLLSDDISSCGVSQEPVVFPGPSLLRIRRDVFERVDFRDTEIAFESPQRVTLALDASRRGDAGPVPLRGVVLLRRSEGAMSLVRADPTEAVRDLFNLCFTGNVDRARAFQEVATLVSAVPVWYLARQLDYGEMPAVVEKIATECVRAG
jgi:hypothetical protein